MSRIYQSPLHSGMYGGRFVPYIYRKECGVEFISNREKRKKHLRYPDEILGISGKIRAKQGITYANCPAFAELVSNDPDAEFNLARKMQKEKEDALNKISNKDLQKKTKEKQKQDEILKRKRKLLKDLTVKDIRAHLQRVVKYHCQEVENENSSFYPLPGFLAEDGDLIKNDDDKLNDDDYNDIENVITSAYENNSENTGGSYNQGFRVDNFGSEKSDDAFFRRIRKQYPVKKTKTTNFNIAGGGGKVLRRVPNARFK